MLSTMCQDLSRTELICQMPDVIKTITKITATVKPLISTARYKQEVKLEKAPVLLAFYFPHGGRSASTGQMGESSYWQGSPEKRLLLLFYGPSGKGKEKGRVTGKILNRKSEWRHFFEI